MSARRMRGILQAAGAANASAFVETGWAFISKIQVFVEEAFAAANQLIEKQLVDFGIILLTPAALIALVFAVWRFTADLGWTEAFVISDGFFSHWQVWMALAVALKWTGSQLQTARGNRRAS